MRYRRVHTLAAALALAVVAPMHAAAQMFVPTGRDTLRGLPGVEVVVEALPDELRRLGLSAPALHVDVARRLVNGGVAVYPSQHDNPSPAKPYVYLHLTAVDIPGGGTAVAVQLHLRQMLRSAITGSNVVNAMTWDAHTIFVAAQEDGSALTQGIGEIVDSFVVDWRRTR